MMKIASFSLALAAMCLAPIGLLAQEKAPATPPTKPAAPPPADYTIGIDDVLEITVMNHPDLFRTSTVLPDGKIAFPEVGEVKAAGRTSKAIAADIQKTLETTRNNVVVFVTVREVHSQKVRILGAVRQPSGYDMKPGWRLMDLVAVSGGLNTKPALVTGRLIRKSGEVITLDISKAMLMPASDSNLALVADDLILIDQLEPSRNQVHVVGQVGKPGAYDLQEGLNLLSLLAQAGNPTDRALLTKAYVVRAGKSIPFDLYDPYIAGKGTDALLKFELQANDVLFVPENQSRIAVMGNVSKPGFFPIPEKGEMSALTAFNLAGGQSQGGEPSKAVVVRRKDGKTTVLPINIDDVLRKGNLAKNVDLLPDDIVYVPQKGERRNLGDLISPLSTLYFLGLRPFR
jgi:polysaccharide export outer membrane protein